MRILAIIGSPRKGNTYQAVQRIQAHMEELGQIDFDYFMLRDMALPFCRGCESCIVRGELKCPDSAILAQIEGRMMAADGIILASPVYSMQVTGLIKNLIDHLSYHYHRPRLFQKHALVVVTSNGGGMKETAGFLAVTAKHWGLDVSDRVSVFGNPDLLTSDAKAKRDTRLALGARRFHQAIQEKRMRHPGIADLIWFRIWQANARSEAVPADHDYWAERGWLDADYYYQLPISPLKKGIVALFMWVAGLYIKRVFA